MSQYKEVAVGGTVYFWFAANLTTGAAGDGATPLYDVRLAGAASTAAPTASGTPTLLTHANYTDGLHEIAIDTTAYAEGEYAVFCTLTISSVNPAGFVGSFLVTAAGATSRDILAAILVDTAEIGAAGAGLTNINLPNQTMDIIGNITGNLSGSVGSVTGAVGSVTGAVGSVTGLTASNLDATISSRASAADMATALGFIDTEVAAILADTNELQTDWANGGRLDLILNARASQTSVDDLPTNAELATALGTADDAVLVAIADLPTNAELATALGTADDAVLAAIAALNNLSAAQVNAEVVDALATDTYAEPTGVPAATASLASKIGRLHQALRNAVTVTATKKQFFDDAGVALWEKDLSDDGTTYLETEGNAP